MGPLGGVGSWLAAPENKAALLQFSLAALQPTGGNSTLGHIANAVAHGAEARDRNIISQDKLAESEQERELTEARLGLVNAQTERTRKLASGSGGAKSPTWSQMWAQRARDEKGFNTWVKTIAEGQVDPTAFEDPDSLVGDWLSDPAKVASLRAQYAEYQRAVGGAPPTGVAAPMPAGAPAAAASTAPGGDLLAQAKAAIAAGAPRDAVISRLRERGVDPTGL